MSYCDRLGSNKKLQDFGYGILNLYDSRFDLFTIICMLEGIFGKKFRDFIKDISPNFAMVRDRIESTSDGFQCRLLETLRDRSFKFPDKLLDNVIKNPYIFTNLDLVES